MINWLNQVLFVIGNDHVTIAEILGFITGLGSVYYVARENWITFPVSIANAIFFFILFITAKFYADAWLQVMYLVLNAVGWWAWLKAGPGGTELVVVKTRIREYIGAIFIVIIGTAILWPILHHAHDIAPFWDAVTTALSVAAQLLLNFKRIGNWYFWIVADLIYIPLYLVKNLYLTSLVYVAFLGLCFYGYNYWKKRKIEAENAPSVGKWVGGPGYTTRWEVVK